MLSRATEAFERAIKQFIGRTVLLSLNILDLEARVGDRIVLLTERGVALVVEGAVGHAAGPEELPHGAVVPVEDREYAHEGGPALARICEWLQVLRPGVGPSVPHDDGFDALLID